MPSYINIYKYIIISFVTAHSIKHWFEQHTIKYYWANDMSDKGFVSVVCEFKPQQFTEQCRGNKRALVHSQQIRHQISSSITPTVVKNENSSRCHGKCSWKFRTVLRKNVSSMLDENKITQSSTNKTTHAYDCSGRSGTKTNDKLCCRVKCQN